MFILQVILNLQKLIFEHVIQIQHWWKALEWKKGDKGEARQLWHTQGFKMWITTRSSSRLAMWCTAALKFFSKSTQNIHYFWNLLHATLYNYWHEVVSRIWIQSRCGFIWGTLHGTVAITAVVVPVVLPPLPSLLLWWWWWCPPLPLWWWWGSRCRRRRRCGGVVVLSHRRRRRCGGVVVVGNAMETCLAEFQTPTFFDRDFNFNCSTLSWAPKIMKIIKYVL